jgi:hypothetical protein
MGGFSMVMLNNQMVIYVSLVGGKLTILKNDGVRQWEG